MPDTIYVINPQSTLATTQGIDRACEPLRMAGGPLIECVTLADGPPSIQSERDADSVAAPLARLVADAERRVAAFVVACFGDPGLHAAREATRKPVLGVTESGFLAALMLGHRVGVIGMLPALIPRHSRSIRAMGIGERYAGERAVSLNIAHAPEEARTLHRMIEVARELREQDRADALVMGCVGFAQYRERIERAVGIPVVEPTQAAIALAIGRVRLGW